MNAAIAKVAELLRKARDNSRAWPPDPSRDPLVQMLDACIHLAGGETASIAAVRSAVEAIASRAVVLATEDKFGVEFLTQLGSAFNACIEGSDEKPLPTPRAFAAPSPSGRLVAARGRAVERAVARELPPPTALSAHNASTAEPMPVVAAPVSEPDEESASDDFPPLARLEFTPPEPAEMPVPARPAVVIVEPAPPMPSGDFHDLVIGEALEVTASLARDRNEASFSERTSLEARLLAQIDAIAIAGTRQVPAVLAWWAGALESPLPWSSWAATFALGCLAGQDAAAAIILGIEALPHGAIAHGMTAAEALSLAPAEESSKLPRLLLASPHPIARAVGIDVLSRQGALSVEELRPRLLDPNVAVVAAAARGAALLAPADAEALVPVLRRWMHFPHAAVAWPAARALLRWGFPDPYEEVRACGRLIDILGVGAAEVLVLSGRDDDLPLFQTILSRAPASRAHFSVLARFGHPGAWAYLLHWLEDDDLASDAADALTTVFGALVPPSDRLNAAAWKRGIAGAKLSPAIRYRTGAAWHPELVAAELLSGALSRLAMEARLDELVVRAKIAANIDLSHFLPDVEPALSAIAATARGSHRGLSGSW